MGLKSVIIGMLNLLYENIIPTTSDDKDEQQAPQSNMEKYKLDDGFTGVKKLDCPKVKPTNGIKKVSKEER